MSVQPTHNLSLAELDRAQLPAPFTPLADHLENGPRMIVESEARGCAIWTGSYSTHGRPVVRAHRLRPSRGGRSDLRAGKEVSCYDAFSSMAMGLDKAAASLRAEGIWQG